MPEEVLTDVKISKVHGNSREPIIVETKTTTTTTTVTKRICIANDANVDLTDIQSLLECKDSTQETVNQINALLKTDDRSKNAPTFSKDRHHTTNKTKDKSEDSFLSSTKIHCLTESNEIENLHGEKEIFDDTPQSFSSNLSKIVFEKKDKNISKKMPKVKSEKKETKETMNDGRSIRLKSLRDKSNSNMNENNKYIDGLINEYMTLEKNSRHKRTKKREKEEKKKEEKKPECAPLESKDLSAIFEQSTEIDSPLRLNQRSPSPIAFDGFELDDYKIGPDHDEPNVDDVILEGDCSNKPETSKTHKVLTEKNTKRTRVLKRLPKISKKSDALLLKQTELSKQSEICRSTDGLTPIKIYSPSTRGKLRTDADNRLKLTKKMIEKKLQKHPNGSKFILQRLGRSNEMTIDADSRLIYYPNENSEFENEDTNNIDFLSVLQKQSKPLLVKESYTNFN